MGCNGAGVGASGRAKPTGETLTARVSPEARLDSLFVFCLESLQHMWGSATDI